MSKIECSANLTIQFDSKEEAENALKALEPDNKPLPDSIQIETKVEKSKYIIKIKIDGVIPTLINTLDEFLTHIDLIEKLNKN
ncbi:MAG: KEOPS complex subunit Pcc1 [Candidatus Ranarchaeia archaeon]